MGKERGPALLEGGLGIALHECCWIVIIIIITNELRPCTRRQRSGFIARIIRDDYEQPERERGAACDQQTRQSQRVTFARAISLWLCMSVQCVCVSSDFPADAGCVHNGKGRETGWADVRRDTVIPPPSIISQRPTTNRVRIAKRMGLEKNKIK